MVEKGPTNSVKALTLGLDPASYKTNFHVKYQKTLKTKRTIFYYGTLVLTQYNLKSVQ